MSEVTASVRVNEIKELVREFNAELYVLHVMDETRHTFNPEIVEESGLLQELLDDINPKYHFISDPVIEKGILEFAENKLDLLIIIPKKHSLVSRLFRYSRSKELVLHAHMPVMSIHE